MLGVISQNKCKLQRLIDDVIKQLSAVLAFFWRDNFLLTISFSIIKACYLLEKENKSCLNFTIFLIRPIAVFRKRNKSTLQNLTTVPALVKFIMPLCRYATHFTAFSKNNKAKGLVCHPLVSWQQRAVSKKVAQQNMQMSYGPRQLAYRDGWGQAKVLKMCSLAPVKSF